MAQFLLITANVGSIFHHDSKFLLKSWLSEFLKTIGQLKPKFIALHCQEFGGKDYRKTSTNVNDFIRTLISSKEMLDFETIRIYLDENYQIDDKFTALGSLYFIHKTLSAFIWDFNDAKFSPVIGREIHSGCIENVPTIRKQKFPQQLFPEYKWSRKGFMKTRWMVNDFIFDTINIHLFHDESNFVSISDFPSTYAKNRRKAFEYMLNSIDGDDLNNISIFIFGDFNFRLDTKAVVERLTMHSTSTIQKRTKNGELHRLQYHNDEMNTDKRLLSVEKKKFIYSDQNFFINPDNFDWLLKQDKEFDHFQGKLWEFDKKFLPSYPFEDNVNIMTNHSSASASTLSNKTIAKCYMSTRCPAWCDRVLMNIAAKQQLLLMNNDDDTNHQQHEQQQKTNIKYDMMGRDLPMGDHKPVYLYFEQNIPGTNKSLKDKKFLSNTINNYVFKAEIIVDDNNVSTLMMPKADNYYSKSYETSLKVERKTRSTTIYKYYYLNDEQHRTLQSSTSNSKMIHNTNWRIYLIKETMI